MFDAYGRPLYEKRSGLVYDSRGRVVDSKIIETFTRRDVLKLVANERKKQKSFQWVDKRIRDAGKVLTQLTTLKRNSEVQAIKMVAENNFFKVGIYKRELIIPENASLIKIHALAEDYFFKKFQEANTSRKADLARATRKVVDFAMRVITQ
jgi:hypothetical protein